MPGHIRKRAKDSWTVVLDLGRDPATGRRRRLWRSIKGTKRDAESLLVQLLHQRDTGIDLPPGKIRVGDFLRRWLDDYARPNTAPKTFQRYSEVVRLHLVPTLGAIPLPKLRPLHIQQAYGRILEKGLSARTTLHCHRILREALQHALRWQLIARNPADAVKPPRPGRYAITVLGPEQIGRLLQAADNTRHGTLVYTAVMTGLRLGELLGLRWQDAGLDAQALYVRQTCQWVNGQGFVFREPKTHRSTRAVALSPRTVDRLRQHRRQQLEERLVAGAAYQDRDLVFVTALGTPLRQSDVRRVWLRIVSAAGLERVRFHDLRHAHATLMLQQGVHPKIVSERLGHSGIAITMDTYSHVLPGLQADAAAGLDQLLVGS